MAIQNFVPLATDNDLVEVAQAFKNLTEKEYNITLNVDGNDTNIKLTFQDSDFKHMSGIHKFDDVKNINFPNGINALPTKAILEKILSNEIKMSDLQKSNYYKPIIENRILNAKNIEQYLDQNNAVFAWKGGTPPTHSKIKADYMFDCISVDPQKGQTYIFIKERNARENVIVSAIQDLKNYALGQKPIDLLLKTKTENGQTTELYRKDGYLTDEEKLAEKNVINKPQKSRNFNDLKDKIIITNTSEIKIDGYTYDMQCHPQMTLQKMQDELSIDKETAEELYDFIQQERMAEIEKLTDVNENSTELAKDLSQGNDLELTDSRKK